jgi:hypothetical protein
VPRTAVAKRKDLKRFTGFPKLLRGSRPIEEPLRNDRRAKSSICTASSFKPTSQNSPSTHSSE